MKLAYVSFVHISEQVFSSLPAVFLCFLYVAGQFPASVFLSLCLLPLEEVTSVLPVLRRVRTSSVRPPSPSAGSFLGSSDFEPVTL